VSDIAVGGFDVITHDLSGAAQMCVVGLLVSRGHLDSFFHRQVSRKRSRTPYVPTDPIIGPAIIIVVRGSTFAGEISTIDIGTILDLLFGERHRQSLVRLLSFLTL
jgi:hypothetical protein